jgi:hypothetical protein
MGIAPTWVTSLHGIGKRCLRPGNPRQQFGEMFSGYGHDGSLSDSNNGKRISPRHHSGDGNAVTENIIDNNILVKTNWITINM